MFAQFVWPEWLSPPRAGDNPLRDEGRKRTRFLLRVAALHATEDGHLSSLSERLGLARGTLPNYAARGEPVTPELAAEIEKLTQGVVRAFYLRPDVIPPPTRAR